MMSLDGEKMDAIVRRILSLPVERRPAAVDQFGGDDESLKQQIRQRLISADSVAGGDEMPSTIRSDTGPPEPVQPDASVDETSDFTLGENDCPVIDGRYHLRRKIGEGGMGEVWLAEQTAPIRRRVAVKLIKSGMDSSSVIQRFEQERQALAMMDHPNIARVFDGGVTEQGHPFFVMEWVQGSPLTQFADDAKLTPNERLELFLPICAAVQHAHQKGIIHRDLKPANILVTRIDDRPVVKVIDFGVAKATGGRLTERTMATAFGAVVGTLEYMAPEQADPTGVDVDTRADIYSLGVVLYELLTGLRPIDAMRIKRAGLAEMIRILQQEEPSKPSTRLSNSGSLPSLAAVRSIDPKKLTTLLRGELDWVVMKCLEKSRDRRYETANALARDIGRYMAHEAVEARPPSAKYRFEKFVRRHRTGVVAASLVMVAVLAGFAGTAWGLVEARRQTAIAVDAALARKEALAAMVRQRDRAIRSEQIAQEESAIQQAVNRFLQEDMLSQVSAAAQTNSSFEPDPDLTVRTALDRAADRIEGRFADRPVIAAAIHRTIGQAYSEIGEFRRSKDHLRRAVDLSRDHLGVGHVDTFRAMGQLGGVLGGLDEFEPAEQLLADAHAGFQTLLGTNDRETLRTKWRWIASEFQHGRSSGDRDRIESSRRKLIELIDDQISEFGERDPDVWTSMATLASLYFFLGSNHNDQSHLVDAESVLVRSLGLTADLPDQHFQRLHHLNLFGLVSIYQHKYDRALEVCEKVHAACQSVLGDEHPQTIQAMKQLADIYAVNNRIDEAETFYRRMLATQRARYGNDHSRTQQGIFDIGQFYLNRGEWAKAEVYYRERHQHALDEDANSVKTHLAARDLATICINLDQSEEALTLIDRAIVGLRSHFPGDNPILMLTREYKADFLVAMQRYDEAIEVYREAVDVLRRQPTPPPIELSQSLAALGQALIQTKQYAEAETVLREAHAMFSRTLPDAWPGFLYQYQIGVALAGQDKHDAAESWLIDGYEGQQSRRKAIPREYLIESLNGLVTFYESWGKPDQAKRWRQTLAGESEEG